MDRTLIARTRNLPVARDDGAGERILILAPSGRDAVLAEDTLSRAGLQCRVCADLDDVRREIGAGAAAVLIGAEALPVNASGDPDAWLGPEPPWSYLPVIVLTGGPAISRRNLSVFRALERRKNVSFLHRPVPRLTLISTLRVAVENRRRQYMVRDLLISREQSERATREREARLHLALDAGEMGTWDWDLQTGAVVWDARLYRICGFTRGDAAAPKGEKFFQFVHPDDREALIRAVERAIDGGRPLRHEFRFLRPDGQLRWLATRGVAINDPDGRPLRMIGLNYDITDRKQAEEALKESEARFRAMADGLPLIVWVHGPEGEQQFVNRTFCDFFGVSQTEMRDRRWQDLLHPDEAEGYTAAFLGSLRARRPFHGEVRARRADGAWRSLESWGLPRFDDDGGFLGYVGASADITARKQGEEALRIAKEDAERANRMKSDFLAAASHDIRQPLQRLCLLQEVLSRKLDDPDQQRLAGELGATITGMIETLNTLLDIDQIESGVLEPGLQDVAVSEVLARLREQHLDQARAKGLALRLVPTTAHVHTDPRLLMRILQNLVSNAIKYTSAGKILIGCRRRGELLRLEVHDTGIGIPAGEIPSIFEKYHRVEGPARMKSAGLGIGLAVVRRLAMLLGHDLDVRSKLGRGSMFAILVPVISAPAPQPGPPAADASPALAILLIENDTALRESLTTLLQLEGFAVTAVAGAAEGRSRVRSGTVQPDVIVADDDLLDPDGIEAIGQVRAAAGILVPAILISGLPSRQDCAHLAETGIHCLQKPVRSGHLLAAVRTLLSRPAGPADEAAPPPAEIELDLADFAAAAVGATVYLVDDDETTSRGWSAALEREGYRVEAFPSAEMFLEAVEAGARGGRGVLVTDVVLPGINGLELQQRLRDADADLPVIVVTGRREFQIAAQAARAGAADVLEKPVADHLLVDAVQRALQTGGVRQKPAPPPRDVEASYHNLTPREREVMALIVEGCHNKEVAHRLKISQRTVEGHRSQIMQKLKVRSLPDLVRIAGLLGVDPCAPRTPTPPGSRG